MSQNHGVVHIELFRHRFGVRFGVQNGAQMRSESDQNVVQKRVRILMRFLDRFPRLMILVLGVFAAEAVASGEGGGFALCSCTE